MRGVWCVVRVARFANSNSRGCSRPAPALTVQFGPGALLLWASLVSLRPHPLVSMRWYLSLSLSLTSSMPLTAPSSQLPAAASLPSNGRSPISIAENGRSALPLSLPSVKMSSGATAAPGQIAPDQQCQTPSVLHMQTGSCMHGAERHSPNRTHTVNFLVGRLESVSQPMAPRLGKAWQSLVPRHPRYSPSLVAGFAATGLCLFIAPLVFR